MTERCKGRRKGRFFVPASGSVCSQVFRIWIKPSAVFSNSNVVLFQVSLNRVRRLYSRIQNPRQTTTRSMQYPSADQSRNVGMFRDAAQPST
jgi:hypothetical protein